MSRRNRKSKLKLLEPIELMIEKIDQKGRGVSHVAGKTVFVVGALPGERVMARYTLKRKDYDEATTESILISSPDRMIPQCQYFGVCGGCVMQHLSHPKQIEYKQQSLIDNLERIGKVSPQKILPAMTGPQWGYRKKARIGVRYVKNKERVLVGFREKTTNFITDMRQCEVLDKRVGYHLEAISDLIASLTIYQKIPQIEVAIDDHTCALVFRHLEDFSDDDLDKLRQFSQALQYVIYLQSGGIDTIKPLEENPPVLNYDLPPYAINIQFAPFDFTQVNSDINIRMINQALNLLDPNESDQILDLFCGLGNFTLPIARSGASVVGVEGDRILVERAKMNAQVNQMDHIDYFTADLFKAVVNEPWMQQDYNKWLLDPPRSGAFEIIEQLGKKKPQRIVYVSCNPATLARDAGILVNDKKYRLSAVGIMDMFPQTAHVESMALFEL